jgi:hypothetical protein
MAKTENTSRVRVILQNVSHVPFTRQIRYHAWSCTTSNHPAAFRLHNACFDDSTICGDIGSRCLISYMSPSGYECDLKACRFLPCKTRLAHMPGSKIIPHSGATTASKDRCPMERVIGTSRYRFSRQMRF